MCFVLIWGEQNFKNLFRIQNELLNLVKKITACLNFVAFSKFEGFYNFNIIKFTYFVFS